MSMSPLLGHCNVLIEVVGESLALLITLPAALDEAKFILVRWKRGETHSMSLLALRLDPQSSEWGAHSPFAFLLNDTLAFPDTTQNVLMLRIAKIDIDDNDIPRLAPLCVLHPPPLNRPALPVHPPLIPLQGGGYGCYIQRIYRPSYLWHGSVHFQFVVHRRAPWSDPSVYFSANEVLQYAVYTDCTFFIFMSG